MQGFPLGWTPDLFFFARYVRASKREEAGGSPNQYSQRPLVRDAKQCALVDCMNNLSSLVV